METHIKMIEDKHCAKRAQKARNACSNSTAQIKQTAYARRDTGGMTNNLASRALHVLLEGDVWEESSSRTRY